MTEPDDIGTAMERRRRLRYWALMLVAAIGALVIGLTERALTTPAGSLAPALAIALAISLALMLIVLNWLYYRNVDELEWANNMIACFWGFNVFLLSWPIWMILERGGLAPEPTMLPIYIAALLTALAVYCWKRFR